MLLQSWEEPGYYNRALIVFGWK